MNEHTFLRALRGIPKVNKSCLTPLLILALLTAGCRGDEQAGGAAAGPGKSVDFHACGKSADCVIEKQKDCCPCNAGGKQIALNAKRVEAYRAARAARCVGDLLCPQMYVCDDKARAVCQAGRCALVPGRVQPAAPPSRRAPSPPAPSR